MGLQSLFSNFKDPIFDKFYNVTEKYRQYNTFDKCTHFNFTLLVAEDIMKNISE